MLGRHATGASRRSSRINCMCMCMEFVLHVLLDPAVHAPSGWLGAGVCGRAWARAFLCAESAWWRTGRADQPAASHALFFAAPSLTPAQVGVRRGSAVESRGHFLAFSTWISRKWGPGGGARWGGEDPRALFVMGRRGCGGAFVAKLLVTQGSRAARWHRRLRVSECALARSEGTTAKTRSTARHPCFAQGVGGHPGRVLFNTAGGGPTLLPFLALRRGTWSTSRCHTAAVEVVGWVMGPGFFFWSQDGGGGLGPPPNTRLLPHTFGGVRVNPINSGSSLLRGCLGMGCCALRAAA